MTFSQTRVHCWLTSVVVLLTACSGAGVTTITTDSFTSAPPTTAAQTTTQGPATTENPGAGFGASNAVALGIGDEYFPTLGNPGYDVEHYILDLVFQPDETRLDGLATIQATATATLDAINIDFATLSANAVFVDGVPATFVAAEEDLVITPVAPIAVGEEFVLDIEYGGTPGQARSASIPFGIGWTTTEGQNYVVAEPDAGHTWFPSNDHPLDKATYTFRLNVPDGTTAAANGVLTERITDLGREIFVWEMDDPMASYLATVVIGDFDIVDDPAGSAEASVPIRHVLPAGTTIEDWSGLERTGEMIVFLEELFGPYPFDTYGVAIVDGFGAALENQTLSLIDRNVAGSFFFDIVLVHELAHHWYGNSVSPATWQDIWLNEGFASYAEWLWIERETSRQVLETDIAQEREDFASAGFPPPGEPPVFELFGPAVYRVGAMTLHALRLTVGDATFFEILRMYAADYAGGNATTADFIEIAERVSATELSDLFEAWLYERAIPEFPARS